MVERGGLFRSKGICIISQKYLAKEMGEYILVRYVINGGKLLHYFGRLDASYLSYIHFERLDAGDTTECRLGMIFFTWCIFKFYRYADL